MARPTDCTPELIALAVSYVSGGYEGEGDKIPSIAGMACSIGIHRDTIHTWIKDSEHPFSDIYKDSMQLQERKLLNGGLGGDFNPAITKMILTKHGYSDKIEQAHTSPDGSMSPKEPVTLNDFYATDAKPQP